MIKKLWKENKGFTLIEIVITTVVLATISIPLLAYFSESMRHSARTKQQQNAVVAAQDAVEELKNASFSLDNDKVADPSALAVLFVLFCVLLPLAVELPPFASFD